MKDIVDAELKTQMSDCVESVTFNKAEVRNLSSQVSQLSALMNIETKSLAEKLAKIQHECSLEIANFRS